MTWRSAAAAGILASLAVASSLWLRPSWLFGQAPSAEVAGTGGTAAARRLTVVTSPVAAAGPDFLTQSFTGIVAARRRSGLAAKDLGRVDLISVDLGDTVAPGQLLVQLDREQLGAERKVIVAGLAAARSLLDELSRGPRAQDIERAEARVTELKANLQLSQANLLRTRTLRDSAAVSDQEYDESRFSVEAILAQLASAEKALDLLREGTRQEQITSQAAVVAGLEAQLERVDVQIAEKQILAPYAGQIQRRLVDEGAVVSAGQVLLEIVEADALEIRVGLPADLASNLSSSRLLASLGGQRLNAQIQRMAPSIDEATRTREIVLTLSAASYELVTIGSAVNVEVQTQVTSQGVWIPTQAMTAGLRGLWAVYIAVPDAGGSVGSSATIERRQVELLRSQGPWSEVQGPLQPQEQLVVEGIHRIVPGQRVEFQSSAGLPIAVGSE